MEDFLAKRESIIERTNSNATLGLDDQKVQANLNKFGANVLTRQKPDSLLKRIWQCSTEPMIIMLIVAGLIALGVNIYRSVTGGEADYWECVGVFCAIALSVVISVIMEGKSAKAFEALAKISDNTMVKAIRNGTTTMLSQQQIVVGDILILSTGDKVPADGRLLTSTELTANESMLTGESVPANKNADATFESDKTPLAERANMLYGGTYITSGNCTMIVTAVGDNTEFGKIAKELRAKVQSTTPLQQKLAKLGKMITILGVSAATIVFVSQLISFAINGGLALENIMEAFVTSIVLIVAAVPEGLPTIVAVSLSINIIKLSKNNALVKKMVACETIGCINIICSDKTGTLTQNKMTVCAYYDSTMHDNTKQFDNIDIMHNICINSTADIARDGRFLGNPTECAMLNLYQQSAMCNKYGQYTHIREQHIPTKVFSFTSETKRMTTIVNIDGNAILYTKGSPELILAMCSITTTRRKDIEQQITNCQQKAMRIIAFAHKQLDDTSNASQQEREILESDLVFDGFVAIQDPLRDDVYDAVNSTKTAGIALKILTGDNITTATAIANQLGILTEGKIAVEAGEIAELTDEELLEKLQNIVVIARSTPTVKMRVVQLLKSQGNVVAVTGDGINDAPALKNADVGIAMGISGTEVSKEASDIVLLNDSFATIVKAVEWGRNIYENFKRFISFQLTVNLASVIVVFVSILLGMPAPFTALELLWINIIMDGPPALTLGLEPNYKNLMDRKPTRRDESIISHAMLLRIVITGIVMSIVFLLQYVYNFLGVTEQQQSTVLFTLFVLFQLFNAFNCRELHTQSIFVHLLKNKLMLIVVGCTFALQVLIIQFAGDFFGTVPLDFVLWLKLFAIAFGVIVISELTKLVIRLVARISKKKNTANTI